MNKLDLEIQKTATWLTVLGLELSGDSRWDWKGAGGAVISVAFSWTPQPVFQCFYRQGDGYMDATFFDVSETDDADRNLHNLRYWVMWYIEGGKMNMEGTIGYEGQTGEADRIKQAA